MNNPSYKYWLLIVVALQGQSTLASAESYFCAADIGGGISFNKTREKWEGAVFRADQKYLVTRATEADRYLFPDSIWSVKKLGSGPSPWFSCRGDFSQYGLISCEGVGGIFKFSKKTLRFLDFYPFGYINDAERGHENDDTPMVSAGTCTVVN